MIAFFRNITGSRLRRLVSGRAPAARLALLAGLVLSSAGLAPAMDLAVELAREAEVRGTKILLEDVADLRGPGGSVPEEAAKLVLAPAPTPGYTRYLTLKHVRTCLDAAGYREADLTGSDGCLVALCTQTVPGEVLKDAAFRFLERRLAGLTGERTFELVRPLKDVAVPEGDGLPEFEVVFRTAPRTAGTATLEVRILVDGEPLVKAPVTVKIRCFEKVLVARGDIRRHEAFDATNTVPARMEVTLLTNRPARTLKDMDLRKAKRTIRAGRVICVEDGYSPLMVERGRVVDVTVIKGNLSIATRGVAKRAGRLGDVVEMENPKSGKVYRAVIVGPDRAEVRL